MEFCNRLTKFTCKPYRLPSEAEWECACRAETTSPFNFGPTISTDIANYRGIDRVQDNKTWSGNYGKAEKGENLEQTLPVGTFSPNNWGLYDTHGNIWEWCADDWHENYEGAPNDGSVWNASNDSGSKVNRGGSFNIAPADCRAALRGTDPSDYRNGTVGFRLLLPLAPRIIV